MVDIDFEDVANLGSGGLYGAIEDADEGTNPEGSFLKGLGNVMTGGTTDEVLGRGGEGLAAEPNDDPNDPNSPDYDPAFRTDIPKPSDPSGPVANPK